MLGPPDCGNSWPSCAGQEEGILKVRSWGARAPPPNPDHVPAVGEEAAPSLRFHLPSWSVATGAR